MDSFKCPKCSATIEGEYVQREDGIYFQIGGVLMRHGYCAGCGRVLYFPPSKEKDLPAFLARHAARMAKIDADIAELKRDVDAARTAYPLKQQNGRATISTVK